MDSNRDIAQLLAAMTTFDAGDPRRIQHFLKVHDLARAIGVLEGLEGETLFTLEAAALVHDIAIRPCEAELGRCDGRLQEEHGPKYARALLQELKFDPAVMDRVCWLVGHHHTYTDIRDLDYQILVEADCLVNLYEDDTPRSAVEAALERIFRTESGAALCRDMFGLREA